MVTRLLACGPQHVVHQPVRRNWPERNGSARNRTDQIKQGTKANITLLADMTGDGIVGDNTLEGNEEALRAFDITIELDQLRFANRIAGRMADQKTVVNFREQSRDALAYAMADRIDQLAFLTLAGVAYTQKNNGALRTTSASSLSWLIWSLLLMCPLLPANRHRRWDATNGLAAGDTICCRRC